MEITRAGNQLHAVPVSNAEIDVLVKLGFSYAPSIKKYLAPYQENTLLKLRGLGSSVSLHRDLEALIDTDWHKTAKKVILPNSKRAPLEHQQVGVSLLLEHERFLLAWGTGSGKSNPAVTWSSYLIEKGLSRRALILTESTVSYTWQLEHIPKDSAYKAIVIEGTGKERIQQINYAKYHDFRYLILNYDAFRIKGLREALQNAFDENDILILDESHNIKSMKTERFKELDKLADKVGFRYICELTGTPISERLEDIYTQAYLIDEEHFGSIDDFPVFRAKYCYTFNHRVGKAVVPSITGYKNVVNFVTKLRRFTHCVRTEDVLDLPPKNYNVVRVDMPEPTKKMYKKFLDAEGAVYAPKDELLYMSRNAGAAYAVSRQICNNWLYINIPVVLEFSSDEMKIPFSQREVRIIDPSVETNPKLQWIVDFLQRSRMATHIVCQFKHEIQMVRNALTKANIPHLVLDGSIKPQQRYAESVKFADGVVDVTVCQLQAVSTGLDTLKRADAMIFFSPTNSGRLRDQMEARIFRQGITGTKHYYDLLYIGSVEPTIYQVVQRKLNMQKILLSANIHKLLEGDEDYINQFAKLKLEV